MYVPEKLKTNRFRVVAVAKPRDMYARFGYLEPNPNSFGGDNYVVPEPGRKSDDLALMDEYDKMMQKREDARAAESKSQTED